MAFATMELLPLKMIRRSTLVLLAVLTLAGTVASAQPHHRHHRAHHAHRHAR